MSGCRQVVQDKLRHLDEGRLLAQLRVAVGGAEDVRQLGERGVAVDVLECRREVAEVASDDLIRASMSCCVQPAGMGPLEAAGEAGARLAATDGAGVAAAAAAEVAAVGDGGDVAAPDAPGVLGVNVHPARDVGAQAAMLAATRPPPVTAAPRRKPRRVSERRMRLVEGVAVSGSMLVMLVMLAGLSLHVM